MPRLAVRQRHRGFNVNGQRNQSNNFLLDGASNNDSFNTGFVLRPPPTRFRSSRSDALLRRRYGATPDRS
jgi:hypothetical protein